MSTSALIDATFKTTPYFHQYKEFEISAELEVRALLWQMRTGKTKLIIDTACHLFSVQKIDTVLVLAPNGVHENWVQRELPVHSWEPYQAQYWRTKEAKFPAFYDRFNNGLEYDGLSWFTYASETVTREDVRKCIAQIIKKRKSVMLVVDECDDYGSPSAKKTSMVRALATRCSYRRILTGTVAENSPLRVYSQFELLKPQALGFKTYESFKRRYSRHQWVRGKTRGFSKCLGYSRLDELRDRMASYSSVVLRSECEDMPGLTYIPRRVEMSEKQKQVYADLVIKFTTLLDKEVSIGENTNRLMKLQQVGSGFLIDEFQQVHMLEKANPRLDALVHEVTLTGGRNIIWCAFRRDIDLVSEALRKEGRKVLGYHGRSSADEKAAARVDFAPNGTGEYDDIVGHPKSGGRGLNLSGADKIIWYSHTFDAMLRNQANERATHMGGKNVIIVDLVSTPTDQYILDKVADKVNIAENLAREGLREVLNYGNRN